MDRPQPLFDWQAARLRRQWRASLARRAVRTLTAFGWAAIGALATLASCAAVGFGCLALSIAAERLI